MLDIFGTRTTGYLRELVRVQWRYSVACKADRTCGQKRTIGRTHIHTSYTARDRECVRRRVQYRTNVIARVWCEPHRSRREE